MRYDTPQTVVRTPPAVWRAVVSYAVFASLWACLSNLAVASLTVETRTKVLLQALETPFFIVVTATFLFGLVRRLVAGQQRAFDAERDARLRARAVPFLRDRQAVDRLLFEANPQPMWIFDRESSRILAVNDAAVNQYGYSSDEFTNLTLRDIGAGEERERRPEVIGSMQREERSRARREVAALHRRKDGSLIDVRLSANDLMFDGRVACLVLAEEIAPRYDLERQSRAGDEALRRVMARVDDGLVAFDLEGRYTHVNRSAARMLGREHPEDLIGRTIWSEFPGIGKEFRDVFETTLKTRCPATIVYRYEPWDRWFENRLYPSSDGLSMYFTEVTERRRAEDAIRRSELRHRLAGSRGHVWEWDIANARASYPVAFWDHLGIEPPDERDSESVLLRLIHPDDVVRRRDALHDHLARRVPFDLELRARHSDGLWRWFHVQGQAVWDEQGRATYMAGTNFEITARIRAEEELRASEAYRRGLFDQLGDGVLLLDEDLRILDANQQAQAMFGYDFEALRECRIQDLVDESDHARLQSVRGAVLAGARSLDEWLHVRADGSRFPAEVTASVIDGNRTLAVLRDISRRRNNERTLLAYQLELSELTRKLLVQEQVTSRRLAQTLHDRLGQTLALARLHVEAGIGLLDERAPEGSIEQLQKIDLLLGQSVGEVRQVLTELRPPLLEAQGLGAALDNEIGERGYAAGSADLVLEQADHLVFHRWPADIEYAAFMVAREAITNALKHAGASLVRVILEGDDDALDLQIVDDGRGMERNEASGRPGHLGMVGMRERAIAIGARFTVDPVAGGGTRVGLRWRAGQS